jgi:CRP/FNR family transcriptional regulator, dissimilatory nitrate respiration regulator
MNLRDDRVVLRDTRRATHARPKAAGHSREITAALRGVAALRALPATALTRLAAGATRIELARGTQLFEAGTHCTGLYVIASGRMMLCVGNAVAGIKVIRLAEPGDVLGLAATLLGVAAFAGAEALVDSSIVLIPRDSLLECAGRDAQLGLALATMAAREARGMAIDIESISLQSGRERIVSYLLACATTGPAALLTALLPAKKSIIASRLSVTPEYFSRTLHELITAGAIDVNGRQIIIRDAARLRGVEQRTD